MSTSIQRLTPTIDELRTIPVFADLPAEGLEWFASQMVLQEFATGEVMVEEGSPAESMVLILEGETRLRIENTKADMPFRTFRAPAITGMLPYSRMAQFPATVRAMTPTRIAKFPAALFPQMIERMPVLGPRLVGVLTDRVREFTKLQDQREKMAALGKISAGLAHELNNPASAVRRASGSLRDAFQTFRDAATRLDTHPLTPEQRAAVPALERQLAEQSVATSNLDSLERSDCEEEIAACLDRHGVPHAWDLAPALVDAGCHASWFENIYSQFPAEALPDLLARIAASLTICGLLEEIENSSSRISDLVRAIKEYTYLDQGPEQEIDVHHGIESTLLMLRHRLKHGIEVKLDFDRSLPKICAHASELNQVWTNLIDNAIDAMEGKGELLIRTSREFDRLVVEIADSGPGVPQNLLDHIFEPFFTTKPVGKGTGLGLEMATRIVREHSGEIAVQSVPGDTRFQVYLPLPRSSGGASS